MLFCNKFLFELLCFYYFKDEYLYSIPQYITIVLCAQTGLLKSRRLYHSFCFSIQIFTYLFILIFNYVYSQCVAHFFVYFMTVLFSEVVLFSVHKTKLYHWVCFSIHMWLFIYTLFFQLYMYCF